MYSLLVIVAAVLFVVFIFKYDSFASGFSWVGGVIAPVVCGIVIAYIINPLVCWFENKVFRTLREGEVKIDPKAKNAEKRIRKIKDVRRNAAKALAIIISFIIVLAALTGICIAVVPNVADSIIDLANQMPTYVKNVEAFLKNTFANNPDLAMYISEEFSELSNIVLKFSEMIQPMASDIIGSVSTGLVAFVSDFFAGLSNVVIGFIIAIYFLSSKERLIAQMKKVMFALFKNDKCQQFLYVCQKCNKVFKHYIISELLDAVVVFVLMLVGCLIMDMPYAMLIAVVCGITNLIPFFGPFIGGIPCGFLILLADEPIKVLWFGIFVLVLQQVDGNIIKPFLCGETMGVPAIWVLISTIIGSGLFGIPGMILGAPVFAVFYLLFAEFISAKLKKKNMPTKTDRYVTTEKYNNDYAEIVPETDTQ
ncbi:MAG: AI-2E family transporter [Oscillospiraceae bacterium]|nr:AI-2E family transporter [Oscillospiraceae bacterium]